MEFIKYFYYIFIIEIIEKKIDLLFEVQIFHNNILNKKDDKMKYACHLIFINLFFFFKKQYNIYLI